MRKVLFVCFVFFIMLCGIAICQEVGPAGDDSYTQPADIYISVGGEGNIILQTGDGSMSVGDVPSECQPCECIEYGAVADLDVGTVIVNKVKVVDGDYVAEFPFVVLKVRDDGLLEIVYIHEELEQ